MNLQTTLQTTFDIARDAGALLRHGFYQPKTIDEKSSASDWVTQFDMEAEALIVDRLQTIYPDHAIFAEEGSNKETDGELIWYVDPLDGTNNFAHGLPHFCVSMALYRHHTPLIGVVYDPLRDEAFCAAAGLGATLRQGENERPLSVSATDKLAYSLLATGYPYDKHVSERDNMRETAVLIKQIQGIRANATHYRQIRGKGNARSIEAICRTTS